ncbi:MAG: SDR family oxidoreductase [Actinobacteria bacterium]|nr:SDR family oxidoreductase [Actinomycetota bacterium]
MGILSSNSALVVGGSQGIGRVVAEAFAGEGCALTIVARSAYELEKAAEAIRDKRGVEVQVLEGDIALFKNAEALVKKHLSAFGSLDVVVNTAAVQGPIGPLWENDPEEWASTVEINLIGSFNICRAVVPVMTKQKRGAVILFSGGGAAYARPYFSAYSASKTGILRLVETLACELEGTGVRVYAVAPGAVKTRMTEEVIAYGEDAGAVALEEAEKVMNEGGTSPEKAAKLCKFLAAERPAALSGKLIHVNEPYGDYCALDLKTGKDECGLLRRVPFKDRDSQGL